MKKWNFLPISLLVIFTLLVGHGCNKSQESEKGSIDFGMNELAETILKSTDASRYDVVGALVSIEDLDGEIIYDKEMLNFYTWGEAFVTERLSLDPGKYALTEFLLIDSTGNVIWATPLEGSKRAAMVEDPLPIYFGIQSNTTTHVSPQVVWIGNTHPSDFGYVSFNVEFVEKFCLGIVFKNYYPCWGNDSIMSPDSGFAAPEILNTLKVYAGNQIVWEGLLMPDYNRIMLPRGREFYTFVVMGCRMQQCYKHTFKAAELLDHYCNTGFPLEIICNYPNLDIFITPEEIHEPTIEQGVFGKIAVAYGGDIDTINGYDITPVVRDLYLYNIGPDVSIDDLIDYNTECNVFPVIDSTPTAIVRSNSNGFFQLKLEAGRYLYMVRTESGFYIDLYLSSRVPGELKIAEGEVTHLNIIIYPCYW